MSVIERLLGREGPRRGRSEGVDADGIAIRQMRRRDLKAGTMADFQPTRIPAP